MSEFCLLCSLLPRVGTGRAQAERILGIFQGTCVFHAYFF